jgi:hypothetical protein
MLKKILIGLVLVVGGFVAFAATRPDTYKVVRTTKVQAPAAVVFEQLDDLKKHAAWSPWEKRDPNLKKTFAGPAKGVGQSYSWEGNKEVGKGTMTITESQPPVQIKYKLEFKEPFASVASTGFGLTPDGDKAVTVTWSIDGNHNLITKAMGIFSPMDSMMGPDFEKGLAQLKTVSEEEAKKQAEAEAKAKAEAVAAAAAAAAQAQAAATPPKGKGKRR